MAFQVGSTGFYELACMPFGQLNLGYSLCRMMEMCLGDQLFTILLLYLDDICVFAATINEMVVRTEMVLRG